MTTQLQLILLLLLLLLLKIGGVGSMKVVMEYAHKTLVLSLATRKKLGRQIYSDTSANEDNSFRDHIH